MDYKKELLERISKGKVEHIYYLYDAIKEIEMDEFKKVFFALGKECVEFTDKDTRPMVTYTGNEEPINMNVLGVYKEGDSIAIVGDYYGDTISSNLRDIEYGHLDFLKDNLL